MNSRQLISDVLARPDLDKNLQQRLQAVNAILNFAGKNGLNRTDAYRYYIQTDKTVVSYLVQAAYADRLEPLTWWFPVVGRVPYRGYFDEEERDAVANELERQGYDVAKSGVGAFSSLGWFDDPIYSAMLKRQDFSLAHLLFHELTHRTFWSPGSAQFNENLAEYVADFLTTKYFTELNDQKTLEAYRQQQSDLAIYHDWLLSLRRELEQTYSSLHGKDHTVIKDAKNKIFSTYLKARRPKFGRYDFIGNEQWNNARVLGAGLYSPDFSAFRHAHLCKAGLSIGDFLIDLKLASKEYDDQFAALASICKG